MRFDAVVLRQRYRNNVWVAASFEVKDLVLVSIPHTQQPGGVIPIFGPRNGDNVDQLPIAPTLGLPTGASGELQFKSIELMSHDLASSRIIRGKEDHAAGRYAV